MNFYFYIYLFVLFSFFKIVPQHKFIEKCNTGASKMLAKIKEAKIIRETAVQNQLPDSDDVKQSVLLLCVCTLVWSL